jgi:DNA repair exonuclease SbcCD ATPase subunit
LRIKSNVWRALERHAERGASLSELESRFSAVVSRDAVRDAYEFVRLHRALSSALEQLEPKLEPLSSLEALSDARAALEMIKKALDGSRRVFLKGEAADALRKLRLTAGVLEELLARWRSALEAERAKREGEVGKYKEYLARLEQVRAQRGMRHSTYAKLRSDYESKLRSAERTLAALDEALRALERALQGLSGASR